MSGDVDAILVAYHSGDDLVPACESALAAGAGGLIVVDNSPAEGATKAVRARFPGARVEESDENVGFARAVNRGLELSRSPRILLLNPDARLEPGAVRALGAALDLHPRAAAAGPRIERPDGRLELSANRTMSPLGDLGIKVLEGLYSRGPDSVRRWVEGRYSHPRSVRSLSAACMLLRRRALDEVDGFDERFFLYAEDVDLSLRLRRAGWELRFVPAARARHVGGGSGHPDPEAVERAWRASQAAYYAKHHPRSLPLLKAWVRLRYGLVGLLGRAESRQRARRMLDALRESSE